MEQCNASVAERVFTKCAGAYRNQSLKTASNIWDHHYELSALTVDKYEPT